MTGAALPFAEHMALHMANVALLAPLLAWLTPPWPAVQSRAGIALLACGLEWIVVWGWHIPWLHHAARNSPFLLTVEQSSFLLAGFMVWKAALPSRGSVAARPNALAGAGALFLTAMHMTLLGALLTLAPRGLYHEGVTALEDQRLGGLIMLAGGALSYGLGALYILGSEMRRGAPADGR